MQLTSTSTTPANGSPRGPTGASDTVYQAQYSFLDAGFEASVCAHLPRHCLGTALTMLRPPQEREEKVEVMRKLLDGRLRFVVTTEMGARGLDIPGLSHVVNLDLPTDHQHYVHRAGRTGRAGRPGDAVCIFTERELEESGALTRALRVKWRMRRWLGDGGLERWSHASARSRPASA